MRSWVTGSEQATGRNHRLEIEAAARRKSTAHGCTVETGPRGPVEPRRDELLNPNTMPRGTLLAGVLLWAAIIGYVIWLLRE